MGLKPKVPKRSRFSFTVLISLCLLGRWIMLLRRSGGSIMDVVSRLEKEMVFI